MPHHYAVEFSYDGTGFKGWQSQPDDSGVQDAVENALTSLGERVRIHGAGRTDAGVHARAQVAHFTLTKSWEPRRLVLALNAMLPAAVSAMRAACVSPDFHARRSAVSREYRYFIWNASTCYPYLKPYVLWLPGCHYDWTKAAEAARIFVGEHDFRAFCRRVDCPEDTRRTVTRARLYRRGKLLLLRVEANAFLTNMIRIMVGNLLSVAAGKRDAIWLSSLLEGQEDRRASAQTVSPGGLFFWKAKYPAPIAWD